jgi:hypothetical protein
MLQTGSLLLSLAETAGAAAGLLWGCGLLVARPLLPRRYLPLLPLIAPLLGFSLISAVAHYAGAAGGSLRDVLWLFVGLAAAGWVLALCDRRLRRLPRSSAPALAVCLLAFFFAIVPLLLLGYLTTIGETIDGVSYAVRSEYLQTAPLRLPELEPGKPYLGWVRFQLDLLRAGDVYLVGLLGLLTGRRSYELLSVVPALFFALTASSAYVLGRIAFGLRRPAALMAAGLLAAHNLLLWPVYDNFLSQAVALSFLPLVLASGVEGARRPDWRAAALFAVLFTGLMSVYPIFAVSALAAVLLFWGLAWLLRPCGPRARSLGRMALWWVGAFGLAVLWNGVALARSDAELGLLSGALISGSQDVGAGNILVFPPAVETFGLVSHAAAMHGSRWERVPLPVLNALGLALAGLAVYGWSRLRARGRLAAAALLTTGVLLVVQQRWGAHYPYGYFKALTTVVPLVMLLVAAGLASLRRARRPGARWLAAGAALLLLVVNLKHSLWNQSFALGRALLVDRELIGIARAASEVEPDAWVLLDVRAGPRQHWLGYLLRERRIRFREPLWFGDVEDPAAGDAFFRYAVVERELDGPRRRTAPDEPWYDPSNHVRRGGGGRYELRERRDALLASVHWDRRWPEQAGLVLALGSSLSVQLGPEIHEGGLEQGSPRTIQVRLYNLGPPGRFEINGAPLTVGPGGWLLDIDLGCVAGNRIGIGRSSGDVLLADVRVLRTVTGSPGECLETVPLSTGAAYVEQDDLGNGRIRFRTALLRPEGDGQRRYRLGLHAFELSQGKVFGVWSLDFPLHPRVQHGSLEIDLRDRSSRGAIDGNPAGIELTNAEHEAGTFEAQAVWWRFNPLEQLRIQSMLWFHRQHDGGVQVLKTVPAARLQVLH